MVVYPVLIFVVTLGGFLLGMAGLTDSLQDPGWFAAILVFVLVTIGTAGTAFLLAARWWMQRKNLLLRREAL